jgi:SagB-type dehydrogenase family enzyme
MGKKHLVITLIVSIGILIGGLFMLLQLLGNKYTSERDGKKRIKLPAPNFDSNTSIEQALLKRRSVRNYNNEPLKLAEISQLLWAGQGITAAGGYRTAPSAGALYPLELYVVVGNVENIADGIYKYEPNNHELAMIIEGDKRIELCNSALYQESIREAPASIVISAVYERTTWKYGERGIRYVHIEVGHVAQNIYLQAVSLNLGVAVIGAFDDDKVKKVINLSSKEHPLYIMPVGKK